jgi:hypothetical protein
MAKPLPLAVNIVAVVHQSTAVGFAGPGSCAGNLILAVRLEIKAHPGGSSIYVHFLGVKKCS